MADVALSADDKKWKAESDARTLSEAEIIKGDKSRLEAAQGAATSLAKESTKEAEAMTDVASTLFNDMLTEEGA